MRGEYWNYKLGDGTTNGAYFKQGEHWGVLLDDEQDMDPHAYVLVPPKPPLPSIPQGDGPISTPLSMSPATSAETSLNSTVQEKMQICPYLGARPKILPTTLPFHFTPLLTDGDSMAPMEHMRFLKMSYFPTRDEMDGPVVRYSKLHNGNEEDNLSVLETAFMEPNSESLDDEDEPAVTVGAVGGFSDKLRNLNPFRKR